MYLSIDSRGIIFKECFEKQSIIVKDNTVVFSHNIPTEFLGLAKKDVVSRYPSVSVFEFNQRKLFSLIISAGKKLSYHLPEIFLININPSWINFYTLHLELQSFLNYFGSAEKFLKFLKGIFLKVIGRPLNFVIGTNPFLNSIALTTLNLDSKLLESKPGEIENMICQLSLNQCFFLKNEEKSKLFHLRVNSLNKILILLKSSKFQRILSSETLEFLKNFNAPLEHYRIYPENLIEFSCEKEIFDFYIFYEHLLENLVLCREQLERQCIQSSKAILFLKARDTLFRDVIEIPKTVKETKTIAFSFCEKCQKKICFPIAGFYIVPIQIKAKKFIQRKLLGSEIAGIPTTLNSRIRKFATIQRACPELRFFRSLNTEDKAQSYDPLYCDVPSILFELPIPLRVLSVPGRRICYIIYSGKKIKIVKCIPHCLVLPEWWNRKLSSIYSEKKLIVAPRRYYKALTASGTLLWLFEADNQVFLHGVWS
ncbi:MAG: hypothetical protein NZT61_00575 [Deltaproteobacteria bacterium]|nr:hypothetical protein [Deltaproteobacteria bacterium]